MKSKQKKTKPKVLWLHLSKWYKWHLGLTSASLHAHVDQPESIMRTFERKLCTVIYFIEGAFNANLPPSTTSLPPFHFLSLSWISLSFPPSCINCKCHSHCEKWIQLAACLYRRQWFQKKTTTNWFNAFRHLSEDDGAKCDIFPFKLWHKYSQWCLLEDADVKVWRNMHVQIKLLQAKLDLCVQNVKLTKSTLKAKDDLAGFSPGNRCRVLQSCNIKTVMKYHQESRAPLWFFIASVSLVPFGTKCDTLEAGICDYLLPPCPVWASRWPWKREFLNAK